MCTGACFCLCALCVFFAFVIFWQKNWPVFFCLVFLAHLLWSITHLQDGDSDPEQDRRVTRSQSQQPQLPRSEAARLGADKKPKPAPRRESDGRPAPSRKRRLSDTFDALEVWCSLLSPLLVGGGGCYAQRIIFSALFTHLAHILAHILGLAQPFFLLCQFGMKAYFFRTG